MSSPSRRTGCVARPGRSVPAHPPGDSLGALSETTSAPEPTIGSRIPLPEGTLPVGAGLLVAGVASYLFFKIGVWALGEHDFAPVSALWFATFALAPGLFLPLEQEAGRALAHRKALGIGGRPVMRKVTVLGASLATVVSLILLAASGAISKHYFSGNWIMVLALVVSMAAYAPAHLTRGLCSGTGRFNSYAIVMGADGAVRIILCVVLAVVGVKTIGAYGFVVAVAPLLGVIFVLARGDGKLEDGPPASWAEITPNLGWLLLGSLFAAGLVNAGPIATGILADKGQDALLTKFSYGVLMTRIPLFLFQAVQAALLPRLARLAAKGDMVEFKRGFRQLMLVVIGVGTLGVVGSGLLGPFIVSKVYNADLSHSTMIALALGSAFYMVALATAQAVIALHGHAFVAIGWTSGMASFVLVTAVSSHDLFRRVEYGLVAGSGVAMLMFVFALRARLNTGVHVDASSILEAAIDQPFEG